MATVTAPVRPLPTDPPSVASRSIHSSVDHGTEPMAPVALSPLWAVPVAMTVVLVATVVGLYAFNGDFWGGVGLGAYLAFWLGGGFGSIVAGVVWAHRQES